jgi:hypothetical protein
VSALGLSLSLRRGFLSSVMHWIGVKEKRDDTRAFSTAQRVNSNVFIYCTIPYLRAGS